MVREAVCSYGELTCPPAVPLNAEKVNALLMDRKGKDPRNFYDRCVTSTDMSFEIEDFECPVIQFH